VSDLNSSFGGRAWTVGDSVDTNQLAGGGIEGKTKEETLRINCLRGQRPDFTENVQPGDLVVAGTNFGCGSSRQTAVEALALCGVSAVLAEGFARIFRRNSIALAMPAFVVPGITAGVADGDQLVVDYPERVLRNVTQGTSFVIAPLSSSVEAIYAAGGLTAVIAQRLAAQGVVPAGA
jgi:3-isopropylmalate/(R)-2-methylmalate dehydratase small subunit